MNSNVLYSNFAIHVFSWECLECSSMFLVKVREKVRHSKAIPETYPRPKYSRLIDSQIFKNKSTVKYFNQRLLNNSQMFVSDPNYIFYLLSVTQQQKLNSEIRVALRKVCSRCMTAGMLSKKICETVETLLAKDKAYRYMNSIKGTPAY